MRMMTDDSMGNDDDDDDDVNDKDDDDDDVNDKDDDDDDDKDGDDKDDDADNPLYTHTPCLGHTSHDLYALMHPGSSPIQQTTSRYRTAPLLQSSPEHSNGKIVSLIALSGMRRCAM